MDIKQFQHRIRDHYNKYRRSFPWRDVISPYRVVVSEIMLQQTQTHRVQAKFDPFIEAFPDFSCLAQAPFHDVLALWKGLGYNRRALALHKTAQIITEHHEGVLSNDEEELVKLPGIGQATAKSIVAFAFNKPVAFIETNIRTVYIDAFFPHSQAVHDREIMPLVAKTLDKNSPREWYYALMDYGVMLKKTVGNKSRQSKHYHRQSQFLGSDRQIRGLILQALLAHKTINKTELPQLLDLDATRILRILNDLCSDRLVRDLGEQVMIA